MLTDIFFWEVVVSGLLAGVMYSLVALGFVLIFKSSGIFNFAQGVLALFAGLTLVGFQTGQVPFAHLINWLLGTEVHHWGNGIHTVLAIIFSLCVMILLAWVVVRVVLRPLVNQEGIMLFMATIGLAFVLEGLGDLMWGANVKTLDVGLPSGPSDTIIDLTGMFVEKIEIAAAIVAIVLVGSLMLFSQYTKMGRALRAVADDHQAALSVGISLETIWWIVWSIAGLVALVAGIMWGAKSGVQFSLSLIALKALP
ncbi:MAG: branched-chain amino acid ABC transporter permease, partial [Pseudomonadota bacterium]